MNIATERAFKNCKKNRSRKLVNTKVQYDLPQEFITPLYKKKKKHLQEFIFHISVGNINRPHLSTVTKKIKILRTVNSLTIPAYN